MRLSTRRGMMYRYRSNGYHGAGSEDEVRDIAASRNAIRVSNGGRKPKIAFVCDTAYQVFNAMNLIIGEKLAQEFNIHVYLGMQFYDCKKICKQLEDDKDITKVICFNPAISNRCLTIIRNVYVHVNPYAVIRQLVGSQLTHDSLCYNAIYISCVTPFSKALIFINEQSDVLFYDDGIGSYSGYYVNGVFCSARKRRLAKILFNRDLDRCIPSVLYLNNASMCSEDYFGEVRQIPLSDIASRDRRRILRVFGDRDGSIYAQHEVVYLSQPDDDGYSYAEAERELLSLLEGIDERAIVRPHPRQKSCQHGAMVLDEERFLWEIICSEWITNNHVLISMISTAQMVPKALFGKEPALIFLYKIFFPASERSRRDEMDRIVERIRLRYSDPSLIVVPENLDEFAKSLLKIRSNR